MDVDERTVRDFRSGDLRGGISRIMDFFASRAISRDGLESPFL